MERTSLRSVPYYYEQSEKIRTESTQEKTESKGEQPRPSSLHQPGCYK
ncbi:hypothetical protein DFP93_10911 [Aneurinibacillus soli]|uniref:Uncharacterized protein n=1 Tax=Aneurinibacillus soli TaxID=1500254 RepID=A0A0U5C6V0_9BACL|nr:hypothetical protein DFP93_10911 [Aneurinibacillus soli]BAU27859.1 hypothetical protein CB4_02033 [Aneurinibacillus soli]